ncbi:sensor histidine kinase [Longitalea luteola]|uniref:sensor histidine kinase n=1 Tax=Longitalea luteola TaxID=2812563 RepID=UPI001A96965D|nr:sensor histidine kinase [Longitalea luteola]
MSDGWSLDAPLRGHESVYYAIIDQEGRIVSMNTAMNAVFGPGTTRQLEKFQSLLSETDREIFDTLLANNDPALQSFPVNLYTYAGPNRQLIFKWSFFQLISGKEDNGYILCAGLSNENAVTAESATILAPGAAGQQDQQSALSGILIKMLDHERLVIGQELHDNVNQLLASAKLHLDLIQVYKADNQKAKDVTIQLLKDAIDEIKKLSRGMVLQKLQKDTLLESVRAFIEDIRSIHKINIVFGIHQFKEELISDHKKINIYRILQEQFRNIIEHSRAKTVVMTLETDDRHVELIIDDDGIGFDPGHQVDGIGLINIRERARHLHGRCEITTAPGKGCRLHVTIPL